MSPEKDSLLVWIPENATLTVEAIASLPSSAVTRGDMTGIAAVIPRSDDPNDDLIVYEEEPHRPTIDWILGLTERKSETSD